MRPGPLFDFPSGSKVWGSNTKEAENNMEDWEKQWVKILSLLL